MGVLPWDRRRLWYTAAMGRGETSDDRGLGRFVWPPGRDTDTAAAPLTADAEVADSPTAAGAGPSDVAGRSMSLIDAVREIERVWLGLRTPPLRERLAAAGWRIEDRAAACWRCGVSVGAHEADETGCGACRRTALPWDRMVRLGEFEGVLREAVHEVKFTKWRRLGDELGRMLGAKLAEELDRAGVDRAAVGVVPVPMSFWRRMGRGIDHSRVIARGVAAALSRREVVVPVLAVMRKEYRPPQWSVPVGQRGRNVARSMSVVGVLPTDVRTLIVIDDVTTTRSTLRTACAALREVDGNDRGELRRSIWCGVVAATPDERRTPRPKASSEGV